VSSERWRQIGDLFDQAVAAPVESREALVMASPAPTEVKVEVLSLLEAHAKSAGFLDPPGHLSANARVGAYRIERVLGRGGMGVVYLAEDLRLHRLVALKALPPQLYEDEKLRARLRKEARAAAALSHPAIATVYALEEIDNQVFIASEYLEGQTLRQQIADGPLEAGLAVVTGLTVARALAAAHDRGVVHRDIKPENIIRTHDGAVKILDFGLATFEPGDREVSTMSRLTDTGVLAGTPLYMAPEQLLGQPTNFQTDHFAFGVLLYELILARHPFGDGSLPAIIARVLAGEPTGPTGFDTMPDAVWLIVDRCLQKTPADRFATTGALVEALEDVDVPVTAPVRKPGGSAARQPTAVTVRPALAVQPKAPPAAPAPETTAVWWWQFHQAAVALIYFGMLWPVWLVREWLGAAGAAAFFATLVCAIVAGSLRLHLSFTAATYPGELDAQRRRIGGWVRIADIGVAAALVLTGLAIADGHTGWGALFVSVGCGTALAFLAIEPATARAAFHST